MSLQVTQRIPLSRKSTPIQAQPANKETSRLKMFSAYFLFKAGAVLILSIPFAKALEVSSDLSSFGAAEDECNIQRAPGVCYSYVMVGLLQGFNITSQPTFRAVHLDPRCEHPSDHCQAIIANRAANLTLIDKSCNEVRQVGEATIQFSSTFSPKSFCLNVVNDMAEQIKECQDKIKNSNGDTFWPILGVGSAVLVGGFIGWNRKVIGEKLAPCWTGIKDSISSCFARTKNLWSGEQYQPLQSKRSQATVEEIA